MAQETFSKQQRMAMLGIPAFKEKKILSCKKEMAEGSVVLHPLGRLVNGGISQALWEVLCEGST
jgi:hypothetical protein|eukprot:CAMPEP_0174301116 /NCGR_PEP_ID=MMETSP0809-20121228/58854_1 /TAXON_ID=73025 ORGANISM="Eutreptiella gymnastica-like, Strain CCMP1594" /NCGR_SAMPLE_ID=MMETSP0809 /ASSEMBLY_ACC=CAM_ASM_000658 /LENGTH=63 /DNA_ID=CAMNT_0015406801 /DNA_START=1754 /DNA_END=1945 /DNA_ORIENTATION=-